MKCITEQHIFHHRRMHIWMHCTLIEICFCCVHKNGFQSNGQTFHWFKYESIKKNSSLHKSLASGVTVYTICFEVSFFLAMMCFLFIDIQRWKKCICEYAMIAYGLIHYPYAFDWERMLIDSDDGTRKMFEIYGIICSDIW